MAAIIVKLECITNMHVGNGDVNYNIIDNEVERDLVTGYPTINASGVKGALREYFEKNKSKDKTDNKSNDLIMSIFGGENSQGQVKILGADMVAIPGRATGGDVPFYLISTKQSYERTEELGDLFVGKKIIEESNEPIKIEVEGIKPYSVIKFAGKEIYEIQEEEFKAISLPVLARNVLNNGISKNLWYEEVVPHESIFVFPAISEDENLLDMFASTIDGKIVQFGGNASIGYGLCKVSVIGKKGEQNEQSEG